MWIGYARTNLNYCNSTAIYLQLSHPNCLHLFLKLSVYCSEKRLLCLVLMARTILLTYLYTHCHFVSLLQLKLLILSIGTYIISPSDSFKLVNQPVTLKSGFEQLSRSLMMTSPSTAILESPSAERNKGPIWDVLSQRVITDVGPIRSVLEIAAGCGVHTIYLASQLLQMQQHEEQTPRVMMSWLPTDPDHTSRLSIDERVRTCTDEQLRRVIQSAQPLTLNEQGCVENYWSSDKTTRFSFSHGSVDLVISINQIHISPWSATVGLMRIASQLLKEGGALYCYGPYKEGGTAVESNIRFDQSLRDRDPSWGLRDLEQVITTASKFGLSFKEKVKMPANNLSVIFIKKTA